MAEGVTVLAMARKAEAISAWAEGRSGIVPLSTDLSDIAAVDALAERLLAEGGVDILVNNSGGPPPGAAGDGRPWRLAGAVRSDGGQPFPSDRAVAADNAGEPVGAGRYDRVLGGRAADCQSGVVERHQVCRCRLVENAVGRGRKRRRDGQHRDAGTYPDVTGR